MSRTLSFSLILGLALGWGVSHSAWASPILPSGANSGYIMGIAANAGVTTNGSGTVTGWADEVTNAQLVNGGTGNPKLSTMATPNGTHAAISFVETGTGAGQGDGLSLNNAAALSQQNLAIYVVANVTDGHVSQEFISNYNNNGQSNGWAAGMSDGTPDSPKWFTGPDNPAAPFNGNTGATLNIGNGANNAYLMIDTATPNGINMDKTVYAGNTLNLANTQTASGSTSGAFPGGYTIPYNTGSQQVGVGYLNAFGGLQYLTGSIAEILVYNTSASGYSQAAVTSYLEAKYFAVPEPTSVVLLGLGAVGLLFARRKRS